MKKPQLSCGFFYSVSSIAVFFLLKKLAHKIKIIPVEILTIVFIAFFLSLEFMVYLLLRTAVFPRIYSSV